MTIEQAGLEVETLTIGIPMRLQRRGGRKLIVTPEGAAIPSPKPRRDETLIKALVRAHRWRRRIESGQAKSITDLAEQEGVTDAYVCRLLPARLPGARYRGSDPRWAAAKGSDGRVRGVGTKVTWMRANLFDQDPARASTVRDGSLLTACRTSSVGDLRLNALAYLAQRLIVLFDPAHIVLNLHHAYGRREFRDRHYASFNTGPSATADIEGVLIHGAQGVRSLSVLPLARATGGRA